MNTINCKSFKEQLAESLIEGNGALISEAMNHHREGCANCSAFYTHIVAQFKELEKEKTMEVNPYLANKILLKTSLRSGSTSFFPALLKNSVSMAAIVIISLSIGIGLNSFFYPAESDTAETETSVADDMPEENTTTDDGSQEKQNDNDNSENNTLTLNE